MRWISAIMLWWCISIHDFCVHPHFNIFPIIICWQDELYFNDNNVVLSKTLINIWSSTLSKDNMIISIHDLVPWSFHMTMCLFGLSTLQISLAPLWNNLLSYLMIIKAIFTSIQTHDHTHKSHCPIFPKNENVMQTNMK